MTGYQLKELEDKEDRGVLTKKEAKKLERHRASGGKKAPSYGEKRGWS
jgi:hypothetical protein